MEKYISSAIAGFLAFNMVPPLIRRINSFMLGMDAAAERERSPLLKFLLPAASFASALVGDWKFFKNDKYERDFVISGLCMRTDLKSFALMHALVFPVAGALCSILCFSFGIPTIVIGLAAGRFLGHAWISAMIRERARSIERDLPFLLDLMSISISAGSDSIQSMIRISSRLGEGPLKEFISEAARKMASGKSRREVMSEMAAKSPSPELASFASLLVNAERLGVGVSKFLRSQGASMRSSRLMELERRGMVASQMMVIPIVMLIMPATFIVLFGPVIVRFASGGVAAVMGGVI
ncbi:MAG TPA: type II secretion system F family protein [bacterium]|nr:MAG: Bacterial type II secretion system protein F domain protein [bacterium ADurb.Bin270]HPW44911.1 type II secretion system F family protein [bacterium]HQC50478.1 type II secretion system F family protein [bacterium]